MIRGALADDAAKVIRRITDAIVAVVRDDAGQPHVFAVRMAATGALALDIDGQWVPVGNDGYTAEAVLGRCIREWSEG
ncbi:MAG: hypothetical protein N2688_09515, partial [Burkholderiaceae bacterium]|nr:hypothetical protein [Burkholderiaceae bacterium]